MYEYILASKLRHSLLFLFYCSAVDPGVVKTSIMREVPPYLSYTAFAVLTAMGLLDSPESAVNSILDAALASPVSFSDCNRYLYFLLFARWDCDKSLGFHLSRRQESHMVGVNEYFPLNRVVLNIPILVLHSSKPSWMSLSGFILN